MSRFCLYLALVATAVAQQQDLTSLSFEEFMNLKVSSVSRALRPLARSAAAVHVITREDIRRSGAVTLPDVLRLAPGVHVARIATTTWAIGIRGFNSINNNKLQVMIDGRTIYSPLMSGVIWSGSLVLLEDIERIEVIRGPGAAMWGANAVSGVINIITRSARATQSGLASVSAGGVNPGRVRARIGGAFGRTGAWRAWGQTMILGPTLTDPSAPRPDLSNATRGGVRIEYSPAERDSVMVDAQMQGGTGTDGANVSGNRPDDRYSASIGGYALGRWEHVTRRGDSLSVQAYHQSDWFDAASFQSTLRTADVEVQYRRALGAGHELMVTAGSRLNQIDSRGSPAFSFDPPSSAYAVNSAAIRDEWTLAEGRLNLDLAAKIERYTLAGQSVQPSLRLMWTPTASSGFWLAVSRAVRAPAHSDFALRLPLEVPGFANPVWILGSPEFRPEVLVAMEAGSRFQLNRSLALDIAMFRHRYGNLAEYRLQGDGFGFSGTASPHSALAFRVVNAGRGLNQGGEVSFHYDPRPGLQLTGSYSGLAERHTGLTGAGSGLNLTLPGSSPRHRAQVQASWNFRRWSSDVIFRRTSSLPDGSLKAFSQMDAFIARKLTESVDLTVSGQNLLRPFQREWGGDFLYPAGFSRRAVEIGLHWSF